MTGCIDTCPETYAKHLARYIGDPSTIRARTIDQFGRAPGMDRILAWQRDHARIRAKPFNCYLAPKFDNDRKVRADEPKATAVAAPKPEPEPEPFVYIAPIKPHQTPAEIISDIAAAFGLTADDICGPSRLAHISRVRQLIAALLVKRGNSTPKTGRWINRDHSTVLHAVRAMPTVMKHHPNIAKAYAAYIEAWGLG
ncbi:MAG: hypothetical protein J7496_08665 [Novosphingobium sp.]|nr:hypothetical protein [Novosphingobium sp.]